MTIFNELMPCTNYSLSRTACQYVLKYIKASSNLLSESEKESPQGQKILKKIDEMRVIKIPYPEFSIGWIKETAALAIKFGVGNCCEKACVAFCYLLEHASADVRIEFYNNPIADHCFVVIGRNQGKPHKIFSWNDDAAICDPWDKVHSYLIGQINLGDVCNRPEVIKNLFPDESSEPILRRQVRAKANGVRNVVIINQPVLVLRQIAFSGIDLNRDNRRNVGVPMAYELWDYPRKKDIKNHRVDCVLKKEISDLLALTIFKVSKKSEVIKPEDLMSKLVISYLSPNNK